MAKYVNPGDSIECNKSLVTVRKISNKPTIVKFENVDGRFFKYKSNIRSIVSIIGELDPLKHLISEKSNLNLNDVLEAEIIEIFTRKKMTFGVVSNFSHVHGIQGDNVNCFTYAQIITPWKFILEKTRNLPVPLKQLRK